MLYFFDELQLFCTIRVCIFLVEAEKDAAAHDEHGKAVDPELKVWNSNDQWFPKWIGEDSFKFLGKSLVAELSSRSAKKNVLGKYKNYSKLIDETLLTGAQKLWIWEHFAMSKVAWDFLIHDFPPSFVKTKLQPIQTKYLNKWSGLARAADPSVLYRSRENAGWT